MDLTGATWRKSSHSNNGGADCVELARAGNTIGVRDSKNPHGDALTFEASAMRAFLIAIKHAER